MPGTYYALSPWECLAAASAASPVSFGLLLPMYLDTFTLFSESSSVVFVNSPLLLQVGSFRDRLP